MGTWIGDGVVALAVACPLWFGFEGLASSTNTSDRVLCLLSMALGLAFTPLAYRRFRGIRGAFETNANESTERLGIAIGVVGGLGLLLLAGIGAIVAYAYMR